MVPSKKIFNKKTKHVEVIKNSLDVVKTSPVCCVADIPLNGLAYHAKRYGKVGIGFKRSSLIKAGFNPVFYTLNNQKLISHFYDAQYALEESSEVSSLAEELQSQIEEIKSQLSEIESDEDNDIYIDTDIDAGSVIAEAENLENLVSEASNELANAMSL